MGGLLGGRRPTRRPAYRGTTRHAQACYPFIAEAGLGTAGVLIGHDALGRAYCHDPFTLYAAGRLNGPNLLLLGDIGYGKSALVKTYLYRQVAFGAIPLVIDVKGEYDRLAHAVGVTPLRLTPHGGLRLNPLDPAIGGTERLSLLRSLTELLLGRALSARDGAALEQAVTRTISAATTAGRQPLLAEVITHLLDPTPEAAAELHTQPAVLREWGYDLALSLRRLLTGDLAGMFDQPTSPGLALDGPMVTVNLAHAPDAAKPLLMAMVAAWLRRCWATADGRRRIVVQEEAWHLLAQPAVAQMQQAHTKLARAYGVQNILVLHHLADLRAAGDAGTRTAEVAANLLADAATRVIYRLDDDQAATTATQLGLPRAQQHLIPQLGRGSGLWLVGGHATVVHHRLAPDPSPEAWLTDTDHAMRGTPITPAADRTDHHFPDEATDASQAGRVADYSPAADQARRRPPARSPVRPDAGAGADARVGRDDVIDGAQAARRSRPASDRRPVGSEPLPAAPVAPANDPATRAGTQPVPGEPEDPASVAGAGIREGAG